MKDSIFSIYFQGLGGMFRFSGPVFLKFLLNTIAAFMLIGPLVAMFQLQLEGRPYAETLFQEGIDPIFLESFLQQNKDALMGAINFYWLPLLLLYGLLQIYLTGGILHLAQQGEGRNQIYYLRACSAFFFPQISVMILVALWGLVWVVAPFWAFAIMRDWMSGFIESAIWVTRYYWLLLAFWAFFGLSIWLRHLEYARLMVCSAKHGVVGSALKGFSFVLRHNLNSFLLWAFYLATLPILYYAVTSLVGWPELEPTHLMWAQFAVAQAYLLLRIGIRVSMWCGQGIYWNARTEAQAQATLDIE